MKMVKTLKNEVLIRSSHKLRFKRRKCIHSIEQPLISLDLKYFMIQMKLEYLKSILQSRSSLLPSFCTYLIYHATFPQSYRDVGKSKLFLRLDQQRRQSLGQESFENAMLSHQDTRHAWWTNHKSSRKYYLRNLCTKQ